MNISEVRQKFPQYNDLSDAELAKGLHAKFYNDMDFGEFAAKIGLTKVKQKTQPYDMGYFTPALSSALNIANSALAGFGDELYGKIAPGDYTENRDRMRATLDKFRTDNPGSAVLGDVVGGIASPLGMAGRVMKPAAGVIGRMAQGGVSGAVTGAVSGAGNAKEMGDVMGGMVTGGVLGGALGAAAPGVATATGRMASGVHQKASEYMNRTPEDLALRQVAKAIQNDELTPSRILTLARAHGQYNPIMADVGGKNMLNTLDAIATMPGKTANRLERFQAQSREGRFGRMMDKVGEISGRERLLPTLDKWLAEREAASSPLYEIVNKTVLRADDELKTLLQRSSIAMSKARESAGVRGEVFHLNPASDEIPLSQLDTLKRSLFDIEKNSINRETGGLNNFGNDVNRLRIELINKLDEMTTVNGRSVYADARNAFAGPSELMEAARLGNSVMNRDGLKIATATRGMSESEREAFQIGAREWLRGQLGSKGGQSRIIMADNNTKEKLQAIFPEAKDFKQFSRMLKFEAQRKKVEGLAGGSQTATRQVNQDEIAGGVATDAMDLAGSVNTSNVLGVFKALQKLYGRATTPIPVRNEIGRLLMSKPTPETMQRMQAIMDTDMRNGAAQTQFGAGLGVYGGMF